MAGNAGDILMTLRTNSAEFLAELRSLGTGINNFQSQVQRQFDSVSNGIKNLGAGITVGAIFTKMIEEAEQAESATKKIEQVLRSTNGVAGVTKQQVDSIATSLSKLTGIDDDAIKGGQALLLTFKGIGKDVFPQATKAMLDMSAAMGTDMKSSAIQLGKALNDPTEGMAALQRVGVTFTQGQKDVIKHLQETGDVAGAQKIVLKELESEFGNMSLAARDTLAGAFEALKTSTDNVFEAFGTSGSSGLRYAVEFTITAMDKLGSEGVPQIVAGFQVFAAQIKPVTDGLGVLAKVTTNTALAFNKSWIEAFTFVSEAWNMFIHGQFTPQVASEMIKDFSSSLLQNFQTDFVADAQKKLEQIGKETQERMAMLQKASSQAIAKGPNGEGGTGVDEKAEKKHEQDLRHLADIESSLRSQAEQQAAITAGDSERVALLQAQDKISKLTTLTEKEKAAAIQTILGYERQISAEKAKQDAAEKAAAEAKKRDEAYAKDVKASGELIAGLQEQLDKKQALAKLDAESLLRLEASEKASKLENLSIEDKNRLEQELYSWLKKIREFDSAELAQKRIKAMRDETTALAAKVAGKEKEFELAKKLRDIQDDPKLVQADKDALQNATMANAQAQDYLNQKLEAQKDLLEKVRGGAGSYKDKLAELNRGLQDGTITQKQFNDALKDLNDKHIKDVTKSVTDFTRTTLKGFTDAIASGKSLNDVFKNLAKSVAEMAINKLLIDPISNFIGNAAGSLFGGTMFGSSGGGTAPAASPSGTGLASSGGLGSLLGGIPLIGGLFNKTTQVNGSAPAAGSPADVMAFLGRHSIGDAWKVWVVGGGPAPGSLASGGGVPGGTFGSAPGSVLGPMGGGMIPPGIGLPSIPGGVYYPPSGGGYTGTAGLMPWQRGGGGAAGGGAAYLSAAQTGMALQQANNAANNQTAWMYSQGLISAEQAQTAYLTRNNSIQNQAASGYRMTGLQAFGPAINTPFVLQGNPYAGGGGYPEADEMPPLAPDFRKMSSPRPWNPEGLPTVWSSGASPYSGDYRGWNINNPSQSPVNPYDYASPPYTSPVNPYDYASPPYTSPINPWDYAGLPPIAMAGSSGRNIKPPSGNFGNNDYGGYYRKMAGYRADGGNVEAGAAYMVGERGREAFVPDVNGQVVSNDKIREAFGVGGSTTPQVQLINNSGVPLQHESMSWDPSTATLKAAVGMMQDAMPASKGASRRRRG